MTTLDTCYSSKVSVVLFKNLFSCLKKEHLVIQDKILFLFLLGNKLFFKKIENHYKSWKQDPMSKNVLYCLGNVIWRFQYTRVILG